ncbi:hypothetical protein HYALB_00011349 [Hymenoscyphus albidus]|uniref:Uncharacterized protein n=1 Tax=Hymenoscyphus albidus TaxID=595503 RepID=A0A9N9LKZ5_9HELO|nr:hypothetical protein HYALB_00011349 [Hymenoscyphus albidus]
MPFIQIIAMLEQKTLTEAQANMVTALYNSDTQRKKRRIENWDGRQVGVGGQGGGNEGGEDGLEEELEVLRPSLPFLEGREVDGDMYMGV